MSGVTRRQRPNQFLGVVWVKRTSLALVGSNFLGKVWVLLADVMLERESLGAPQHESHSEDQEHQTDEQDSTPPAIQTSDSTALRHDAAPGAQR